MTLAEVALAALLALARPPAVDAVAERPRLEAMASDIAAAVEQADELAAWLPGAGAGVDAVLPLPFTGPRAREAAALALVAIAVGESALAVEVADCRRGGPAWSSWQLDGWWARGPYTIAELCASPRRAAERALWVLSSHGARCATPAAAFRGYASGSGAIDSRAAREHCRRWERLSRAAGINASCSRKDTQ